MREFNMKKSIEHLTDALLEYYHNEYDGEHCTGPDFEWVDAVEHAIANAITDSDNPRTRHEELMAALDARRKQHKETVAAVITAQQVEAAYREGHRDGYSDGLSDGHPLGGHNRDEDGGWEWSDARAAIRQAKGESTT